MTKTPQEIRAIHDDFDLSSARGQMNGVIRIALEYHEVQLEALSVDRPHIAFQYAGAACRRVRPMIDEALMLVQRAREGR